MATLGPILEVLLPAAVVSLQVAGGAWVVSAAVGMVLALAVDTGRLAVVLPVSASVTVVRSLPQLVVLYLLYFGMGNFGIHFDSVVAAIIGLGIADAVFTAEYFRAAFTTIPHTQREAGMSLGLSHLDSMRLVIIPQAIPFLVPPLLNSLVSLMKGATLAAAIGAPEILYAGQSYIKTTGQIVPVALTIIALYVIVTLPLTRAVGWFERRARSEMHG